MKRKPSKIDTSGGNQLGQENPFSSLNLGSLPDILAAEPAQQTKTGKSQPGGNRRLEIRRLKAGKGGKTVTEIRGFETCNDAEVQRWHKQLKNQCASGGSLKGRIMEIQGDHREAAARYLGELGFKPVLAGG